MSLSAGTKLGPYEIVASLGAGGMGEVIAQRIRGWVAKFAIKVLPAYLCRDPDRLWRAVDGLPLPNPVR